MKATLIRGLALCATWYLAGGTGALGPALAQTQKAEKKPVDLRAGGDFMPTKVHTEQQDQEALRLFAGLRVADVTDGMNNILGWKARGCVGVVTSASARDLDEVTTERVPLYFKRPGRGIRPGRNEIASVNRPVVVGGALVMPGDVIVADGDGVVVVPRQHAEEVARYARGILEGDKAGRRKLYEKLGIPADDSVK
jgi:hypothetical protein